MKETDMRVTMKRIAELAGVSQGAVSAVLNNIESIRISSATREKILKIAHELNYRRDFASSAMRRGKTSLFGFVCGGLYLPFFSELMTVMMHEVHKNGGQLIIMPIDWDRRDDIECLERMFDIVDGVFMCSALIEGENYGMNLIRQRKKPFVLMNYRCQGIFSVSFDFYNGMEKAFDYLLAHGHRGIAFSGSSDDYAKLDAYQHCCRKFGVEPVIYNYNIHEDIALSLECGFQIARQIERQSALITSDYGWQILHYGTSCMKIEIPRDLSVVLFAGKLGLAQMAKPQMTTILLDCEAMARSSVELMNKLSDNQSGGVCENIIILPDFIIRESVADFHAKPPGQL